MVNTASLGGLVGLAVEPTYCASKGAVVNMTREIAIDYAADHINVNAICPGFIRTAMCRPLYDEAEGKQMIEMAQPIGRWGEAQDLVGPAIFLASDDANFVTRRHWQLMEVSLRDSRAGYI